MVLIVRFSKIRALRKKAKLSQAKLAELTETSQTFVSDLENFKANINDEETLDKFLKVLKCTKEDLLALVVIASNINDLT